MIAHALPGTDYEAKFLSYFVLIAMFTVPCLLYHLLCKYIDAPPNKDGPSAEEIWAPITDLFAWKYDEQLDNEKEKPKNIRQPLLCES